MTAASSPNQPYSFWGTFEGPAASCAGFIREAKAARPTPWAVRPRKVRRLRQWLPASLPYRGNRSSVITVFKRVPTYAKLFQRLKAKLPSLLLRVIIEEKFLIIPKNSVSAHRFEEITPPLLGRWDQPSERFRLNRINDVVIVALKPLRPVKGRTSRERNQKDCQTSPLKDYLHRCDHPRVIVSCRFRMARATLVQAASSAGSTPAGSWVAPTFR